MNAAIYIRKSREEKDKPSHRLTVQREQLPAYATAQGWAFTIYDDGHASAAQGKIESLKERARLEADIRAGKTDIILTIELSRLSRDDSLQDYVAWLDLCSRNGVKLATMSRTLDPAQHSDWMLLLMEGGFSSVEMKVLQARMKEGREQAYYAGKYLGGGCPPPYRYDKALGRPVLDQELLAKACRVWELAETMNAKALAEKLGMPHISTRRMLADDRLLFCQALRPDPAGGEPIKCDWEPCLTAEQAARISGSRKKGYGGPRRKAGGLLANLAILVCGYCGIRYRGFKGQDRRNGTFTEYYGCQGKGARGVCPRSVMSHQNIIDKKVLLNLSGILARIEHLQQLWESGKTSSSDQQRLRQIEKEIQQNETKKQRITAAIAEAVIDFADARTQMQALKMAQESLRKEMQGVISKIVNAPQWNVLAEAREVLHELGNDDLRKILKSAIHQIRVYNSYMIIDYNFPINETGSTEARIHLITEK